MSLPRMLWHLACERLARQTVARVPEPDLVMTDPVQVDAFREAGQTDGILTAINLFHAIQTLPLFKAGDVVLDLACGPATLLTQLARLHPQVRFIGVDASDAMLTLAERTLSQYGVRNVDLHQGDITRLEGLPAASVDGLTCNLSLHHLPDLAALHTAFTCIARVLKPEGSVYISDFCRFKRAATQEYFATDRAGEQSAAFTDDFRNSLRAAFSEAELLGAAAPLRPRARIYRNMLSPLMLVLRGPVRAEPNAAEVPARVAALYEALSTERREDFRDFLRFFQMGGFPLACKPW
ncbi:MAG: methyltransferase type 11 [Candidatus Dactylopiibacterium carminicum]|uniref:Class I SAM-dependent methyltransferase n=1 Tax=Candidatus Dactylopiibacterium carminicum TaxID=857335 RepID=A0A272EV21_9RHOO|nr:class I SAM-dependent methyltransferase [Candidatus Dactylopiibacterium carminicum]KAF7599846.1 class I SAM-dependent methyltransferase [Candidatus Dactylopiibacterium carminicum]PAS93957.1 MAG: methyltransferase type 11 [Candidatus Dactylopiibacterium carminicum]PAS99846.1 MAG: hypothetical protein BSR46_05880 [Candidatus Dactylopiibacterium carminicum]